MAYIFPPKLDALRKYTGWFLGVYNASAFTPAASLEGGTVVKEGVVRASLPLATLPLPLKAILFCLLMTFIVSYVRSSRQRLPPQPRRLPIIGNFFHLADKRWLLSRDCKERFGEYRALTQNTLKNEAWDNRRGHVPRSDGKAHNRFQQP